MGPAMLSTPEAAAHWLRARCTGVLRTDSRQVRPGDAFIAWPGAVRDGRAFVAGALEAGAAACLVEAEGAEGFGFARRDDDRVATLAGLKAATGWVADAYFEQPSAHLAVVAVTGTNGKTSTAWWTAQALTALGRRCGVVGTLGIGVPPAALQSTGLTTPDPVMLQAAFRRFADEGFSACAIEASSIGIAEERLAGTRLAVAMFTNFTRDHLDYHGSMQAYWAAKRRLFAWPGLRAAVVNVDDPQGARLAAELDGTLDLWTVSAAGPARLAARDAGYADGGLQFHACEGAQAAAVRSTLIGDYNVLNLLVVLGALRALGVPLAAAAAAVPALQAVPGRMQRVGAGRPGPDVVVDYAHTPDALEQVLRSLRPLAGARGGRLWCVFGCGGNRDATKRPLMGAIAARAADRAVVTSDNPRQEDPRVIVEQIVAGLDAAGRAATDVVVDRRAAIAHALGEAAEADVVLIAGKGHEDYQEIAGVRHPFSDADEARRALEQRRC
jgi:UDP-N-acetylmuramoyl-L-alanyl-D-glutamate--2,6-diaminopimelate ligase